MDIERLLNALADHPEIIWLPSSGIPEAAEGIVTADVLAFYRRFGGAIIAEHSDFAFEIVPPQAFVRSNPVIRGGDDDADISHHWFIIAKEPGDQQFISIDCHPDRLGRCYDSFWETHAVRGDSRIIALSFTELLQRLVAARGGSLYWVDGDFAGYGDAYTSG